MSELQTEKQILIAAIKVFQERGFAGARMQQIADEAEINKSMLHYYFRSKDKLFQKVFQASISQFFPEIFKVLNSDLALVPKIEKLVETYYDIFRKHPHLPRFVIHEMNQHPERFKNFMESVDVKIPDRFVKQIQTEIEFGRMKKIDPKEFVINIIGLCVFPVIAQPMIQTVFKMSDEQFQQFLGKRKKVLPKFILNAVKIN